ncbi:hypothetical protein F5Y04DRAFT_246803 [Hypomontagnella monticulosa]|nr:hypothetical protein F5Y04DRAFT_246803 [Hypomontagnella monticulosa]
MASLPRRQSILHALYSNPLKDQALVGSETGEEQWLEYTQPQLDVNAIYEYLEVHKSFQVHPGHFIQNLPKFCDFRTYGDLTEAQELEFCKIETQRLVSAANLGGAVTLDGEADMFGPATQEGYFRLHQVGRALTQALMICEHDAALIQAEHLNEIIFYRKCAMIQAKLLADFDPATDTERYPGSRQSDDNVQAKCYHAVINYMTAIFIRTVLRNFRSSYWVHNLIAVVARMTLMLQNSTDAANRIRLYEEQCLRYSLKTPSEMGETVGREAGRPRLDGEPKKYFIEMEPLYSLTANILIDLLKNSAVIYPGAAATDDFQISVAMYESLVTGEQALLYQHRDGSIGAASTTGVARTFTAGFQVCLEVWESLGADHDENASNYTRIRWNWSQVGQVAQGSPPNHNCTIQLSSMKSVITAMTPCSLITGRCAELLSVLIDVIVLTTSRFQQSPLYIIKQPRAVCNAVIQTSANISHRRGMIRRRDACPVSETYLLRGIINPTSEATPLEPSSNPFKRQGKIEMDTLRDPEKSKRLITEAKERLKGWVISDNAIIVPYKRYAWGWLIVSTLLVLAGLAVGFSVGGRIAGVDPFNVSIFCWAVAGFLLVVAKAICVENWPWSRFLRGEVPCRSVSEVAAVTGVDAQVILAILIGLDKRTYLKTCGPFNTLFLRHAADASGGFSIDVPIRNSTAIKGGLIPIKVLSQSAPGLVFIYAHSWARYNEIDHASTYEGRNICRDMSHFTYWSDNDSIPFHQLQTSGSEEDEKYHVSRVLGLFEKDCYFY